MQTTVDPGQLTFMQRFVLAALGLGPAEEVPEKLHLQKELFLVAQNNERLDEEADYVPYLKGPYSEAVDIALEDLRTLGLVTFNKYGRHIRLTEQGQELHDRIERDIPRRVRDVITDAKDLFNDLNQDELLCFVYLTYPDMISRSVVKERAFEQRSSLAKRLYAKEKVSLEKAAELAGMRISEFRSYAEGAEA